MALLISVAWLEIIRPMSIWIKELNWLSIIAVYHRIANRLTLKLTLEETMSKNSQETKLIFNHKQQG